MGETLTLSTKITEHQLKELYSDPYIINASKEDNEDFEPIIHPLVTYYGTFVNNVFKGAFLHIKYDTHEIEIHSLLKKDILKYSRDFGTLMLKEIFRDKKIQRATSFLANDMNTVKNYLVKMGFKLEGLKRKAIFKNNEFKDVCMYGITRDEWSKL